MFYLFMEVIFLILYVYNKLCTHSSTHEQKGDVIEPPSCTFLITPPHFFLFSYAWGNGSVGLISTGLSNVLSSSSSYYTPILFSLWKTFLGLIIIQFSPGYREDCTYRYCVCAKLGLCTLSWPTTSEWKGPVLYTVTSGVKPCLTLQVFFLSPTLEWWGHRKAACVGRYYVKGSCLLTWSTYSGHVVSE